MFYWREASGEWGTQNPNIELWSVPFWQAKKLEMLRFRPYIFPHSVPCNFFFFTIKQSPSRELRSNNEYCLRKKPLMSLPTSRSPKQHFKVSTGPALNRAVHMKARVSSDDVQVSHSLKAKAHAVFPWPCRFCDYWSRFIFRSWQDVNMVFFTLLYIMLSVNTKGYTRLPGKDHLDESSFTAWPS